MGRSRRAIATTAARPSWARSRSGTAVSPAASTTPPPTKRGRSLEPTRTRARGRMAAGFPARRTAARAPSSRFLSNGATGSRSGTEARTRGRRRTTGSSWTSCGCRRRWATTCCAGAGCVCISACPSHGWLGAESACLLCRAGHRTEPPNMDALRRRAHRAQGLVQSTSCCWVSSHSGSEAGSPT